MGIKWAVVVGDRVWEVDSENDSGSLWKVKLFIEYFPKEKWPEERPEINRVFYTRGVDRQELNSASGCAIKSND